MTISRKNVSYVEEMLSFCKKLGVNRLNYGLVIQIPFSVLEATDKQFGKKVTNQQFLVNDGEPLLPTEEQIIRLRNSLKCVLKRSAENNIPTNADILIHQISQIEDAIPSEYPPNIYNDARLTCPNLSTRLVIDSQGNVFPCSPIRYPLGNIQHQSLIEIWDNDSHNKIRSILNTIGWAAVCYMCCSLKPATKLSV